MLWLYALVIAYTLTWIHYLFKQRKSYPPGPIPFMFLGNLPQLGYRISKHGHLVKALQSFKKDYGPVFTLWIGPMSMIHIADFNLAAEHMIKNGGKFVDRNRMFLQDFMRKGLGIVASNGEIWQEQRRFALHTLRNFGLGKNIMEERIMEEFEAKFDEINQQIDNGNNVVNPAHLFDRLIGGIVNQMLFSTRFAEESEKEFFDLKHKLDDLVENMSLIDLYCNKYLIQIPYLNRRWYKIVDVQNEIDDFIRKQVEKRMDEIKLDQHQIVGEGEDFVDAYLLKIEADKKACIESSFSIDCLVVTLADLWGAGLETTISTLCWGLIHLLHNPEMIEKIRGEINMVTGATRRLTLNDRKNTLYLNAVITEIMRISPVLNMNMARVSHENIKVGGHNVPAEAAISAQLSLFLSDENTFQNNTEFNPGRYIDNEKLASMVVPFGIGKRACPGESLARAELYLILGNLVQRYNLAPNGEKPSQLPFSPHSMMNRARHFTMCFDRI